MRFMERRANLNFAAFYDFAKEEAKESDDRSYLDDEEIKEMFFYSLIVLET